MKNNLRKETATALVWAALQNWVVKFLSLLLFFVLTRYLDSTQMGLAATVTLLLAFITILSEQGFPNALIQHNGTIDSDLNLPFFISFSIAVFSSLVLLIFAEEIAHFLKASDAAPLIKLSALIPPVGAVASFQATLRKKSLDFKTIATSTILSTAFSGALALLFAVAGFGAISLILQILFASLISAFLLWREPVWKPTLNFRLGQFKQLMSYSTKTFAIRIIDFFSGRLIDFVIISRYSVVELGLYTVGAKLYLTILQLLAYTLTDVTLSVFSKMQNDRIKFRESYLRFIFLSTCTTLPLFTCIAALSQEVNHLVFGEKWTGVTEITKWLFLLGATQVIQCFNASALGASGKAGILLWMNIGKLVSGLIALTMFNPRSIGELTLCYALSQVLVQPFTYYAAMKVAAVSFTDLLKQLFPGTCGSGMAYAAVYFLRNHLISWELDLFARISILTASFLLTFVTVLSILSAKKVIREAIFFRRAFS